MSTSRWDVNKVPRMDGKTVVITGSNSGIGLEAAKVLASRGAEVTLAVRNVEKGEQAKRSILEESPGAMVSVSKLDLADLGSVKEFAENLLGSGRRLSVLINNAGVMAVPYARTVDGFEMQFGTNHLGHFALTGRLLPALLKTPEARVVVVSSMAHQSGKMDFDNLDGSKGYRRFGAYGQSKLANLLFAYEFQRRLKASGSTVRCMACHPGFAATNLTSTGFGGRRPWVGKFVGGVANAMAQSAAMGALPTLMAATEDALHGGEYVGPASRTGMRGYPAVAVSSKASRSQEDAERLWEISERLTGVTYPFDGRVLSV